MAKAQKQDLAIIEAPALEAVQLPSLATVNLPIIGYTMDYEGYAIEADGKDLATWKGHPADYQTSQINVDHNDLPSAPFTWLNTTPCAVTPNPLDSMEGTWIVHDKRKNPNPSKVQSIKMALDEARKEEVEARKWSHVTACLVRDLDRLCVNPLIATYQQALEVAESDLLSVKMLLQSKLADLQFVRQELARLTGKTVKSGKVSSIGTSSNRSRDNADRFGLVGNESAFMSAVSQGSCTMKEALSRCGQVHPQYRLVERMVAAGYLVKVGNTLSLA